MILHLVLFKFNEPFEWGDHEVTDAETATRQHPVHIKEIVGWACGRNVSDRKKAVDFAVIGLFESQETLAAFMTHPDHLHGVSKWQRIAHWQVLDLDIGSDTTKLSGLLDSWAEFDSALLEELKVS